MELGYIYGIRVLGFVMSDGLFYHRFSFYGGIKIIKMYALLRENAPIWVYMRFSNERYGKLCTVSYKLLQKTQNEKANHGWC